MNKTILITGSSRGIGKAIAMLAHEKGYRVILHGKTDSEELNKVHSELKGSIKTFFDVTNKSEVVKGIEKLSHIDVLVNNAGGALNFLTDINEMDEEKALQEFKINVLGLIHCIQAVLPSMIEKGAGSIINIASIKGHPELSTLSTLTYGIAKSGVISLTKSLAKKYADKGIRINSVSPGYVETDAVSSWNADTYKRINDGTLLGRIAQPKEIAPIVLFLASNEASYITGSDILIDGGYKLKGK